MKKHLIKIGRVCIFTAAIFAQSLTLPSAFAQEDIYSNTRIHATVASAADDMFPDISIEEHQIYLGQTIRVEYDVYVASQLGQIYYESHEPEFTNWYVAEAETPRAANITINGKSWQKEPFAIFYITPTLTGKLELPPLYVQAPFIPGKPWITHTRRMVEVIDPPSPKPENYSFANVGQFQLHAESSQPVVRVGNTFILSLTLTSNAPAAGIKLAPYSPGQLAQAFQFFPLQTDQIKENITSKGYQTLIKYHMQIVALKPGNWTIPPFSISTFDPLMHQYSTIESNPIDISVENSLRPPVMNSKKYLPPILNDMTIRPIALMEKTQDKTPLWIFLFIIPPAALLFYFLIAHFITKHALKRDNALLLAHLCTLSNTLQNAADSRDQLRALRDLAKIVFHTHINNREDAVAAQIKQHLTQEELDLSFPIIHKLMYNSASTHVPISKEESDVLLSILRKHFSPESEMWS